MAVTFTAPDWWGVPMLCKTTMRETLDTAGKWDGFIAEPKHDGARCLVDTRDGNVRLYSRNGQEYTHHVHEDLIADLANWMPKDSVIDGELAIISRTFDIGRRRVPVTDFNKTMRILGSGAERGRGLQPELGIISLIAYDIPRWDGVWLNDEHLSDRRAALKENFPFGSERVFLNPQFTDPSRFGELFDLLVENKVEGIIAKNTTSLYVFDNRPNNTWYKVKAATTLDMIVTGYTEGKGKYEGFIGTIEFGRHTDEGVVYVGRCSGMTDELRRAISADRDAYLGKVIEVKSNDLVGTKNEYRTPRHPQFVCFRTDKNPEDCTGEELKQVS